MLCCFRLVLLQAQRLRLKHMEMCWVVQMHNSLKYHRRSHTTSAVTDQWASGVLRRISMGCKSPVRPQGWLQSRKSCLKIKVPLWEHFTTPGGFLCPRALASFSCFAYLYQNSVNVIISLRGLLILPPSILRTTAIKMERI